MVDKKSGLMIAAMLAIFSFLTLAYISSCRKVGTDGTICKHITCLNGGYCNHSDTNITKTDTCICPIGYEGANCATASVTKYYGTWILKQTIIGSDSSEYIGNDTTYPVILRKTATPTTFFISNFNNNQYYNDIICTLDSTSNYSFKIDTISAFQMIYFNYEILSGNGIINAAQDSILATFRTRHKNTSTNWEVDTLAVTMYLQHR